MKKYFFLLLALLGGCGTLNSSAIAEYNRVSQKFAQANADCDEKILSHEFDSLHGKITYKFKPIDAPPPTSEMILDTYPSEEDKKLLIKLNDIFLECQGKNNEIANTWQPPNQMEKDHFDGLMLLVNKVKYQMYDLRVDLIEGKISYGEFAKKSYQIRVTEEAEKKNYEANARKESYAQQMQKQQLMMQYIMQSQQNQQQLQQQLKPYVMPQIQNNSINCNSFVNGNTINTNCH